MPSFENIIMAGIVLLLSTFSDSSCCPGYAATPYEALATWQYLNLPRPQTPSTWLCCVISVAFALGLFVPHFIWWNRASWMEYVVDTVWWYRENSWYQRLRPSLSRISSPPCMLNTIYRWYDILNQWKLQMGYVNQIMLIVYEDRSSFHLTLNGTPALLQSSCLHVYENWSILY